MEDWYDRNASFGVEEADDNDDPITAELGKYSDSPEFDKLKEDIAVQLFEINGQVSIVKQFLESLEGFLHKGATKAKVVDNISKKTISKLSLIRDLVQKVNKSMQMLDNIEVTSLDKIQIISREKLTRDVKNSVQEFQNTQQIYAKTMKEINQAAITSLKIHEEENAAALAQEEEGIEADNNANGTQPAKRVVIQREAINNEEFAYQQNLIQERDREIFNIEQGMNELNEIFKDLDTVIQQQGQMVDNIEANVYTVADNNEMASQELRKALRRQRRSSQCLIQLLIAFGAMLLFFLLVLLI